MAKQKNLFERIAYRAAIFSGSMVAFVLAVFIVVAWLVTGPVFGFSDSWQLVINTGTTIVTFLMVFLIQHMQNKDSRAMQLKLNELVAALDGPSNRLIDIEGLTGPELETLSNYYKELAQMAQKEKKLSVTHSIEEAVQRHQEKYSDNENRE